jgi:hypothetical protein
MSDIIPRWHHSTGNYYLASGFRQGQSQLMQNESRQAVCEKLEATAVHTFQVLHSVIDTTTITASAGSSSKKGGEEGGGGLWTTTAATRKNQQLTRKNRNQQRAIRRKN